MLHHRTEHIRLLGLLNLSQLQRSALYHTGPLSAKVSCLHQLPQNRKAHEGWLDSVKRDILSSSSASCKSVTTGWRGPTVFGWCTQPLLPSLAVASDSHLQLSQRMLHSPSGKLKSKEPCTCEKRWLKRTVDRYRSPALGRTVTISLPAFSGRSASLQEHAPQASVCPVHSSKLRWQPRQSPQSAGCAVHSTRGAAATGGHLRAAATAAPEEMPHMRPSCSASLRA